MMMWFYILGTLAMGFFLIKNIYNYGLYKDYAKTAIFTFEDTRPFYKAMRILFSLCFFIFVVLLLLACFVWHPQDPSTWLSIICLLVGSFLFAFFPFTAGRWIMTDRGIYVYNYGTFIAWPQMIGVQIVPRGKKAFLVLTLKKGDGDQLKKTSYPLMIEGAKAVDLSNMIREFINTVDRKRYRKQFNEEHEKKMKTKKY